MEIIEAIKTRQSVRQYQDRPVDDKAVEMVLEAARWAPSWANGQPWRFIVIRDSQTKAALSDSLIKVPWRDKMVDNPSKQTMKNAPVVIVACGETGKSGYWAGQGAATEKGDWYLFDLGLVMENLMLAAHALGLGTVNVSGVDAPRANQVLAIPKGFTVVSITPLGYPAETPRRTPRKELAELVYHEKWGQK